MKIHTAVAMIATSFPGFRPAMERLGATFA